VSAPGVGIWTALPDSKEGYRTGTSFAAPFMTAVVAAGLAGKPGKMTKADLLDHLSLNDLGPLGRDPIYGRGLVQAPKSCAGSVGTIARQEVSAPAPIPTAAATPASW
jgi:subtilisin family serine protease